MSATVRAPDSRGESQRMRVGVLTNPLSGGNRKGGRAIHDLLDSCPEILHREATRPDEILTVLSAFAQERVELIVVNGGDGTVQAVLTVLGQQELFAKPPLLALLCAGTTSMLPRDVGVSGAPAAALQRVIAWSRQANETLVVNSRPLLQIRRQGQEPLFGMFFGAGAICEGIKIFHSKDNPMGWRGQLMPALTMLRMLVAILFKNQDKFPPLKHGIGLDGGQTEEKQSLLLFVTSLERLFMGMRPYWGEEAAPLYFTAIAAKPKYLLRVLYSLFRSGGSRYATPANGYTSHNVREVQLDLNGDFTLDGELYETGEGPVVVSAAGPALFLCPR